MADSQTRHGRGLAVVVVLALIFFALLTLIILRTGRVDEEAGQATDSACGCAPSRTPAPRW
jgi:hypothetical protein